MSPHTPDPRERRHWESVHICPKCDHVLNLAEIDLKTITTGIVSCLNCDWSGPIEIQMIDGTAPQA
ncbi:hypothetical protein BDD14_5351 [Edaphobacter modestus]|uniref:Uncharacterized protein n=1 Tax=Edaphobacter modestus TaxID=388466 RepID=A0A4Q7Z1W4_9BACT|nr:hypothetical protein BDD14_5351 [Edaphobacter modestus]